MLGAGRDQRVDAVVGHVVVVAVEAATGKALGRGERVQLVEIAVADQMRPQAAVGRPARIVDENRHAPIIGARADSRREAVGAGPAIGSARSAGASAASRVQDEGMRIDIIEHEPPYRVGVIIGSLSRDSINRRLATALERLAPPELEFFEISYADLPLYNRDLDADYPPAALAFKADVRSADALLFVTPEYNRSIPGALKNAIDWGSRPWGESAWADKPTAVIGASPGKIGTAVGQQSLRSTLSFLNTRQMTSPEAYVQFTPDLVDAHGDVTDAETAEFLRRFMAAFLAYTARVLTVIPRS